jgi:hypothetical protein
MGDTWKYMSREKTEGHHAISEKSVSVDNSSDRINTSVLTIKSSFSSFSFSTSVFSLPLSPFLALPFAFCSAGFSSFAGLVSALAPFVVEEAEDSFSGSSFGTESEVVLCHRLCVPNDDALSEEKVGKVARRRCDGVGILIPPTRSAT